MDIEKSPSFCKQKTIDSAIAQRNRYRRGLGHEPESQDISRLDPPYAIRNTRPVATP
ncbi:MAG: hypothetical protein ABIG84_02785 [archaeon]